MVTRNIGDNIIFTEKELHAIDAALIYEEDAKACSATPRIVEQFRRQAQFAREIADKIGRALQS